MALAQSATPGYNSPMTPPPLYAHQIEDVAHILKNPKTLNFSSPGTGKTRTCIEAIRARKNEGRTLVLCPKSIMRPAWGNDLDRFAPEISYSIADASHRAEGFFAKTDVVVMNHDGISWLEQCVKQHNPILNDFCQLIIDESTYYKNDSGRTKAICKLKQLFKYRILLTGTPYSNSLTDIWRQAFICDDGERLGNSFYKFRSQVCVAKMLGNGITVWKDKANMEPVIYHLLKDIVIRHKLEDCISIPPNTVQEVVFELNPTHMRIYKELEEEALLTIGEGKVTAINAAVLANKLLQVASGAVYDSTGVVHLLDTDRYELIKDLAEARPQCIIAFHWTHQKTHLQKLLPHAKVIDGTVTIRERNTLVDAFQAGNIPQLLIHPKSGAHGLTLTAGHATIWASPTYSSEEFTQFNNRIYRAGQTKKTETILIQAKNTIEGTVFAKLQGKLTNMHNILTLFEAL